MRPADSAPLDGPSRGVSLPLPGPADGELPRTGSNSGGQLAPAIILVGFAILVVAREPMFLTRPRFWAEEGKVFFKFAYLHDFLTGLLYIPAKITSYFLLCATLPTALAARLPLEVAPALTTYFCFLFTLTVFALILNGRSYVWDSLYKKVVACGMVIAAAVLTQSAWLNTINLQLFCGMLAVCLLAEDLRAPGRLRRYFYRGLLLFCGASGLYAVVTFPAYVLKAAREKSRESWVMAAILGLCAMAQSCVFLLAKSSSSTIDLKTIPVPMQHRAFMSFFHHILDPFLGRRNSLALLDFFHISEGSIGKELEPPVALAGWISILCYILILYWLLRPRRHWIQAPLAVAFLSLTALTAFGASFGVPQGRYSVVPFFALFVLLLNALSLELKRPISPGAWLGAVAPGLVLVLALPAAAYRYLNIADSASYSPEAPLWRDEIGQWRQHPHRPVGIFPHPRWTFYFPDRERLFAANRSLSAFGGRTINSGAPIVLSVPALSDISWEIIAYVTVESEHPLEKLGGELYLKSPGDRFVFRRVEARGDAGGTRHRLTFSQAVDPRVDDPRLLERFRHVDTLGLVLSASPEGTLRLVSIELSSRHRQALVYL